MKEILYPRTFFSVSLTGFELLKQS